MSCRAPCALSSHLHVAHQNSHSCGGFNLISMRLYLRGAKVAVLFVGILICAICAVAQISIHALAEKVDKHYNNLQTLQADFTEIYKGAGLSRSESGTLWLRRPGRMRWQYEQPRNKLFIVDGKTAW